MGLAEAKNINNVLKAFPLGYRIELEGTVGRIGTVWDAKPRKYVPSVLLKNVDIHHHDAPRVVEALWVGWAGPLVNAGIEVGDAVRLTAEVYEFEAADPDDPNKWIKRLGVRYPADVRGLNRVLKPVSPPRVGLNGGTNGTATLFDAATTNRLLDAAKTREKSDSEKLRTVPVVTVEPMPAPAAEPPAALPVTETFKAAAEVEAATPITVGHAAAPATDKRELFNQLLTLVERFGMDTVKRTLKAVGMMNE